ncbi:MAG: translational GTPase TypA [SAR202 cluster bacterium]|nr:translational GTPase TypA [SAR202 cluster bacterium]
MDNLTNTHLRNVAIIAHVDHGKTSLVDTLLKQSHTFRANQEMGSLIMDSNPLERERGITILAKNTAVTYKGVKINIIDTPGHADFSGEVERVMNMADGCLLVVDAVDGPMPQTKYVLKHALNQGLIPIVVINKIDRPEARVKEVISLVQDLFLELATKPEHLDFPILFASAREGYAIADMAAPRVDMQPLFEAILGSVPAPQGDPNAPLQMLVSALDYDNYIGQIAIGRIFRGTMKSGVNVALLSSDGSKTNYPVEKLFIFKGLQKVQVEETPAGEIVAIAGVSDVTIGDTIASIDNAEGLPRISVEEPTVMMSFIVNNSPFMGREGKYCTTRTLHARLLKELRTNVSLKVESTDSADEFLVKGRGELHLAILIETMRREGYEFGVSRPKPVLKEINGRTYEPYEILIIDTKDEYIGSLTENLTRRLAQLLDMRSDGQGNVHIEYRIPTRGLIGFRSFFIRLTRGNGVMNSLFQEYAPMEGEVRTQSNGVLVASEEGVAVTYGLNAAQGRGTTFIEPGTPVYEGMIIGMHPRDEDISINVTKEKKLTNIRSATADFAIRLTPAVKMSLEESMDFIADDEMIEVTPLSLRLRKKELSAQARQRLRRDAKVRV